MADLNKDTKRTSLGRGLGSLLGDDVFSDHPKTKSEPTQQVPSGATSKPLPTYRSSQSQAPSTQKETSVAQGLANIQSEKIQSDLADNARIWQIDIERIIPNQFQPRKEFVAEKILELTNSVREKGILQPIIVRKSGDRYEIIAGERRWRAAQGAGLKQIPVIVREAKNQESLELALIENIQRHDLNPLEEAEAYDQLMSEFSLTQQDVATKVGKDRATIANMLRLLGLPDEIKRMISNGEISIGHAKALMALQDPVKQREVAKRIQSEKLTVRAAEKLIHALEKRKEGASTASVLAGMDVAKQLVQGLSEDLRKTLGTKVEINYSSGRGKIEISFYSDDDLNRVIERIKR